MILIASPGSSVKPKYVKPKQRVCGPDSAKSPHWGSRWCATVRSSLPFANRLLGLQGLLRPALFILIRRLRKGAGLTREAAPLPLIHTPVSPVTSGASDRRTGAVLVSVIRQHWRQASRCRLNEYGVSCSAPTSSPGTEDICAARAMNPEVDDPTRPIIRIVRAADLIAQKLGMHPLPDPDLLDPNSMLPLGISEEELAALLIELEAEIGEVKSAFAGA